MSTRTLKGAVVPGAGDDLLAAWPAYDRSAGTIIQANDVASARAMLNQAETAGQAPTPAAPWYLDIGGAGIVYRADGTRSAGGTWVIVPINQSECAQDWVRDTWTWGLGAGRYQQLASSSLGVRPYDRRVQATWTCYAQIQSGIGEAWVRVGSDEVRARFADGAFGATQSVTIQGVVLAGVTPNVTAGIMGAPGQSEMTLQATNDSKAYSRLVVFADPITMS
ncbi:MAG: hypothetical protein E6Z28_05910 [Actinomyces urogenitalis]|uniref:hypothetical protein n=1 Tax=Actinomyces urogenitalis TaxID=103621 RepID=UPI0029148355|nr:hypothetical protein [Actinomyces urogenitalis]MDU5874550.1 hypothetical protein [Actinomyces urogenitalis]